MRDLTSLYQFECKEHLAYLTSPRTQQTLQGFLGQTDLPDLNHGHMHSPPAK